MDEFKISDYIFKLETPLTRDYLDKYYKYSQFDRDYKIVVDEWIENYNALYKLLSDVEKDDNLYENYFTNGDLIAISNNGNITFHYTQNNYYLEKYDLYIIFKILDDYFGFGETYIKELSIKNSFKELEEMFLHKIYCWEYDIDCPNDNGYLDVIRDENDNIIGVIYNDI